MAKTETKTEAPVRKNPMKDLVPVFLPRAGAKDPNFELVGLNGKMYQIMRGQTVMVPRPVYAILAESRRNQLRQIAYIDAKAEELARSQQGIVG